MDEKLAIIYEDSDDGEFLNWKVCNGSYIRKNAHLLNYSKLKKICHKTFKKGFLLKYGMTVATIEPCKHEIVMKDMCATCGKDFRAAHGSVTGILNEAPAASVSMIHHVPELIVSSQLAREIGNRDREFVLKARKLVLLVDLDQTLIHSTSCPFSGDNVSDIKCYKLQSTTFYTKIRPYTREFLERMNILFEMHIISYGERLYAHQIASILDPDKIYFGHRILSRDELFCAMYKTRNMQSLFPCGDQLIAIIDDRPDVWQYSDALIQVVLIAFSLVMACSVIGNSDETDHTLEYVADILTKIHREFYYHYDKDGGKVITDLKTIIANERAKVLKNCSVVLSGIVPVGTDLTKVEAYRLCKQFGATVTININDKTTHIIAARWGTIKVHEALKRSDIYVVHPQWLYDCVERWQKIDEKDYLLTKETMNKTGKPLGGSLIKGVLPTLSTLNSMLKEVEEEVIKGHNFRYFEIKFV
ncbi:unnamed protein product [Dracunculus medinensis]|uniref:RNA polymerase II subunit A C-terminal domain phosphatase n=1 Tax=Dracunculus medinensis TaxID=318479 RepID=A0A0N4U5P4_DRAME|nr:unnamed protein product [Dracunculus medinensis]